MRGKEWDNGDEWGLIICDLVETGDWRETLERDTGERRLEKEEKGWRVECMHSIVRFKIVTFQNQIAYEQSYSYL